MDKRILTFKEYVGEANLFEQVENLKEESNETRSVSEIIEEMYESACNEAIAYESDDNEEHTVESYVKEIASLNANMTAKMYENACNEAKDEKMTFEMYERMCEAMKESYVKKVDELKESYGDVQESRNKILEKYQTDIELETLEEGMYDIEVIYESLFSIIARKKRINDLLKKEKDYKKREKLKAELSGLGDDELKYRKGVEKIKAAIKAHKESVKGKKLDDRAKFKYDKKLDKLTQKLYKVQGKEAEAKSKFFKKRSF